MSTGILQNHSCAWELYEQQMPLHVGLCFWVYMIALA